MPLSVARGLRSALVPVLFALACTFCLAVLALPAQAHSTLVSSSPAEGEEMAEAPEQVVLTFNEDIVALGTEVVITDAAGADVSDGEVVVDGPDVTQALTAQRPAGEFTVTWRAVSADGHPISGEFTFTATSAVEPAEPTEAATTEAPTPEPAEEPTDAQDSAGEAADAEQAGLSTPAKVAIFALAAVVVIGGVVVRIVLLRRARR